MIASLTGPGTSVRGYEQLERVVDELVVWLDEGSL